MTDGYYNKDDFDLSLFFSLCNSMREGAAVMRAESREFVYCNQSFLTLFDIGSIKDIDIHLFRKLRKQILSPAAIAEREKMLELKGDFSELVEYISVTGHSFFGEVTIRYRKVPSGNYYFVVINPVDKAFFNLASLGILMVNKKGEIATANPFIEKQFGYSKTELIGKKIELLIPQRFHNVHVQQRKKFVQHPKDRWMGTGTDLYAVKKNGTEFPVEISLGHYPSDGDKYIIAFINDISLRKQAESGLKKLNEELESLVIERTGDLNATIGKLETTESEMQKVTVFQKTLLDKAGAMIVSIDANGIIQTFNPEAERELGYKAEELVGKHTPLIFTDPALLNERAKKISADWDSNKLFNDSNMHASLIKEDEWIYVRKDGSKFPVKANITAMKNEEGTTIGYMGVAFDITRIKQFEQDLQDALERERELSELKTRFVSMASHEFRTPLSTILSSSYLIEKYAGAGDQPKRETHLHRIVSSVNMLSDILNDFLSVGKIEEGKIQIRPALCDIKEVMISIIGEMKNSLKKKQKIWYKHTGTLEVKMDASLLKHIVMNLVSNASKFSKEGSPVEINTTLQNGQLVLCVKDYGIGISKEDQQHLMERFFRGTNAVNIQGTGLGLHIVSKYAELMNGILECKSELEKGTEFIITFNL